MSTHYVVVMGAGSGVGKTTVCQIILAQLLAAGYPAQQLAYIKPLTQCITRQPIAAFCEQQGIPCKDLGNLVFTPGFSKTFIDGLTPNASELMTEVLHSIETLARNKSWVIIDGFGDPASGSVIGVNHVQIAQALNSKVIFVGKPGIGAAIDNTLLCVGFMQAQGLQSIGVIYNHIRPNALAEMEYYVSKRLAQCLPEVMVLGFIGEHTDPSLLSESPPPLKLKSFLNI